MKNPEAKTCANCDRVGVPHSVHTNQFYSEYCGFCGHIFITTQERAIQLHMPEK